MNSEEMKQLIVQKSVIYRDQFPFSFFNTEFSYLIDLRELSLQPIFLQFIADRFWQQYQGKSILQLAGLELACVPLIAAISLKSIEYGCHATGIIVRKSRKKYGLEKMIEGCLSKETETVIIDDIVNTGASVQKCLVTLAENGVYPREVFSIVDLNNPIKKEYFSSRDIHHQYLFSVDELIKKEFCSPKKKRKSSINLSKYKSIFCFRPRKPFNNSQIFCRSNPVVDKEHVYFGTDVSTFYALDKWTGEVVWKKEGLSNSFLKGIWSSPCLVLEDAICYGSYDGNLYCLERKTGQIKWIFSHANFIGSSPFYSADLGLIFVGLEYSLNSSNGRGGSIVAIDAHTGQLKWEKFTRLQVHSSPVYSKKQGLVFCGSNDRDLIALDAENGQVVWNIPTLGICKMRGVLNEAENILYSCFTDSTIRAIDVFTGSEVWKFETKQGNLSTPLFVDDKLVIGSLDNCIYVLNSENGTLIKRIQTDGRFMCEPSFYKNKIIVGNNSGTIFELSMNFSNSNNLSEFQDAIEIVGRYQLPDRVLSKIAYCSETNYFYVHTGDDRLFAFTQLLSHSSEMI